MIARLSDRRRHARTPAEYVGATDPGNGSPLRGCTISDISERGAKLRARDIHSIPDKFALLSFMDEQVRRKCLVRWRSDFEIGIEFLPQNDKDEATSTLEPDA
jgi:hypothetical protein